MSKSMLSLIGILFSLYILTGLLDPYNFSIPAIGNVFYLAAALGLLAAGQTICMLTGGIDLSLAMIATGAAFIVSVKSSSGLLVALSLALLYCIVIGAINGLAIGLLGMNPLIMTLGMNAVLIGVFTVGVTTFLQGSSTVPDLLVTLSTASIIDTSGWIFDSVSADPRSWPFFTSIIDILSWPFFVWVLISAIVLFLLAKTGLGRLIYAIGDNAQAAKLAGVRVWQVQVTTYVMCAILGGIGGILLGGQSGAVALSLANSFLLPSVAAVVIGGTSIMGGIGGYKGTMMGTLILTLLSSLLTTINSSEAVKQMIYGAIVLALAWTYAKISENA
ncbi:MAG: ABC transporter permease [Actinomycetes bacterium]